MTPVPAGLWATPLASMMPLAMAPLAAQALVMVVDEFHFHRQRGLPRWERIGHPLDTLTVLSCLAVAVFSPPSAGALRLYGFLAFFSCLFVTKDEVVHATRCTPAEHWLHALLFVLHPLVLAAVALLWMDGQRTIIALQAALTVAFGAYQALYWNTSWRRRAA